MRIHLWKIIIILMGAFRVSPALAREAPPPTYAAEAIDLMVVDEETGHPLEGVNIVAYWELNKGYFESPPTAEQLMGSNSSLLTILEGVSDLQGHVRFPAWGPKPRPTGWYLIYDAWMVVFKHGYKYRLLTNHITTKIDMSPVRRSDWHGKTVQLTKSFPVEERAELGMAWQKLEFHVFPSFGGNNCEWKQIPRMMVAVAVENAYLAKAKGETDPIKLSPERLIEYWEQSFNPAYAQKCGSIKEFLRSYLP